MPVLHLDDLVESDAVSELHGGIGKRGVCLTNYFEGYMKGSRSLFIVSVIVLFSSRPIAWTQGVRNAPATTFGMADVLEKHALWLKSNGKEGAKADLRQISLEGDDGGRTSFLIGRTALNGVDLKQADFRSARLRNVDFTSANLQDTRFDGANLRWAILANTDLRRSSFTRANLQAADLRDANLEGTIFDNADLSGADLRGAKCLARTQLLNAVVDEQTRLPAFESCSNR
jgi:hypothetical protein